MSTVFLDTAPLIYLLEGAAVRRERVRAQLDLWVAEGTELHTSAITLMELLVHPCARRDAVMAGRYRALLRSLVSGPLLAIDADVAALAAELRARYAVAAADALQLAAALSKGCAIFYTNDRRLRRVREFEVMLAGSDA